MRLVTFRTQDGTRAGRVVGDEIVELDFSDVGELLAHGPDWRSAASADGARRPLAGVVFAPLVIAPPAIICVGQNYAAHVAEVKAELPAFPTLFAKFASSLLGANDDLVLPAVSSEVDWEVELAFVVGGSGRNLSEEQAGEAIAGYTVANDVSMRDWQRRTSQFLQGKAFEASTPVGPVLVTPDELPGGSAEDLRLTCEVDGVSMQDGRTSDLVFGPAAIAAYVSQIMSLEPGMLVLTGTPDGVGVARTPPVFLSDGQLMRSTIEGIGVLENSCVNGAGAR
ncbi:MAG: putative hydrolase [Acidimicrobiaceae bacterium]|jgi:acylpyruvate hydrolase|nr:putative hydrolase [Acidimicrobiaceae bacterium]